MTLKGCMLFIKFKTKWVIYIIGSKSFNNYKIFLSYNTIEFIEADFVHTFLLKVWRKQNFNMQKSRSRPSKLVTALDCKLQLRHAASHAWVTNLT